MSWFKRLSVGAKLFSAFLALLLLMGVMGSVSIWKMGALNGNCTELSTNWMPGISAANALNTATSDFRIQEYRHLAAATPEATAQVDKNLGELQATCEKSMENLVAACTLEAERKILDELKGVLNAYFAESARIMSLSREDKKEEAGAALDGQSQQLVAKLNTLIADDIKFNQQGGDEEVVKAQAGYTVGRNVTLIVLAVNVVLGLGLAICISRWFTKAIVEVDDISNSVASASQQLAAASEQLSSGAQQSASSLEETASSLEEITATVRQNADNADQANQLANSSRETAEKGGAVVAQAVDAMSEINRSSRKIADIITTIDEIAFQTNLLALNAAVEAARAGEQGRGFAVVAGEVRNLAQRSATAAREIKGLIEDSVQKVETGSELVNKSGETLGMIVTSVKRVTDIVAEIAAASREQTVGIEQINKAVAQMDQVTQSNASQTEEMSGTAVALSGQAEQLQMVVAQFNLNRDAKQTTKPSYAPQATAAKPKAPSYSTPSKPAKRKAVKATSSRAEEFELVGAGAGHGGFEEF
ncbi:methyl-accepting chemotaxis protein [Lacipirellula parvula]|uniref:Methyl-accepting transducer domain-containing protein n=1 Tax=Lacipirellula parvula TaxID=2650471 RepID=A0A5K7XAK5_9BACT|nr:methyl-accepting chemotaxis protein [Lacipirellula parvula]BBO33568.1 hypothetical protein PLANPX_3180 [Lacipirellula parvula]